MKHRRIVLARHPVGIPRLQDFRFEEGPLPEPGEGHVVIEHTHLGLSPAARIRMSEDTQGYPVRTPIGGHVHGAAVGRVITSRHAGFPVGAEVMSVDGGLQTHAVSDGSNLIAVDTSLASAPSWLGPLGNAGFTAYCGLRFIGSPGAGETVVVSSAAGAVGSMAVQLARLRGAHVLGIAGGPEKCRKVVGEFGAEACLDHRSTDLAGQLGAAAPAGVDVYFDNVGGAIRDAVWPLMNTAGRVVVCGQITQYSRTRPEPGPDWYPILTRSLSVQGLNWARYTHALGDFVTEVSELLRTGAITSTEVVVHGLDQAPQAFIDMLEGRHAGKVVIEL